LLLFVCLLLSFVVVASGVVVVVVVVVVVLISIGAGGHVVTLLAIMQNCSTPSMCQNLQYPLNFTNSSMVDLQTGSYVMTYASVWAGTYLLYIQVNGMDCKESPSTLLIIPNLAVSVGSVVTGPGLLGGMAGVETQISVLSRDGGMNNLLDWQINTNPNQHNLSLFCPGNGEIGQTFVFPSRASFSSPATWTYFYTPTTSSASPALADRCSVSVCLLSTQTGLCLPVPGSPWSVEIVPNQAASWNSRLWSINPTSWTDYAGIQRPSVGLANSTAGVEAYFRIRAQDGYGGGKGGVGNLLYFGGSKFFFNFSLPYAGLTTYDLNNKDVLAVQYQRFISPPSGLYSSSVQDMTNNLYNCKWMIKSAGNYVLNVMLRMLGGVRAAYYSDYGMQFLYLNRTENYAINYTWSMYSIFPEHVPGAAVDRHTGISVGQLYVMTCV
jgi:hypothetical protein